jgi:superfamily II DNA or RNA helicase
VNAVATRAGAVGSVLELPATPENLELARTASISNPAYDDALAYGRYAGKIPKRLTFWSRSDNGETLFLPRGFWSVDDAVADQRVIFPAASDLQELEPLDLRPYQARAAAELLAAEQGLLAFPTGAGKTHTALELARMTGQRTLVIVGSRALLAQWQERARALGVEPGILAAGKDRSGEHDLVIATQQMLHSRRDKLESAGWFHSFGTVVTDEVHHLPAATWYDLMEKIPARYRYGLSATPHKNTGYAALVRFALGDVVATADAVELESSGAIVRPHVYTIPSAFDFPYASSDDWQPLLAALVLDPTRIRLVADLVVSGLEAGRTMLLPSGRLDMLHAIRDACILGGAPEDLADRLPVLVGETGVSDRAAVLELVEAGGVCLFSTLAGEALDLPRLDALVLALPMRNQGAVEQLAGRLSRPHADKLDPRVIDIQDEQSVLAAQHAERLRLYARRGFEVTASSPRAAWE